MIKIEMIGIFKVKTPPVSEVALGFQGVSGGRLHKQFFRRREEFIVLCGLKL